MRKSPFAGATAGFTLIELIAVLLLTGILAIAVLPRMADRSAFDSRGFSDTTRATLQHARRVAIAQRRTVCGTYSGGVLAFTQSSANGAAGCDLPLPDPAGNGALTLTPPSGVTLGVSPPGFTFDGLGRPNSAVTLTIAGDITRTLTIEADSGYVH